MAWRPRLRVILIFVNLLSLLLPLGAILGLRLYDNELIRMTEMELIAQGSLVAAAFGEAIERESGGNITPYARAVAPRFWPLTQEDEPLQPILPELDIAESPIYPRAPMARTPSEAVEVLVMAAAERVAPLVEVARKVNLAGIRVVDIHGTVVASSGEELGLSLMEREEVRRALEGEHVSLLRSRVSDEPSPPLESLSRGTRVRVFVALPVLEGRQVLGAVILSRTPLALPKALHRFQDLLITTGFFLLAVVLAISLLTSLAIDRPLAALITQTQRVARGTRGAAVPIPHPVTREVGELSESVARMAQTLEARAEYIRSFATHVSHEFKTPLASIRGITELLQDHLDTMDDSERHKFLGMLERDAARLDKLVRRLLDLARADVFIPGDRSARVQEVLAELQAQFHPGLEVEVVPAPEQEVAIDPETLLSILTTLVENSRQHGGEGVKVTLSSRSGTGGTVVIRVSDNGKGISPANAARIFDPFFTTARDAGGTGLGLSVARSLLVAHAGQLTLTRREGGTEFSLELPGGVHPRNGIPPHT